MCSSDLLAHICKCHIISLQKRESGIIIFKIKRLSHFRRHLIDKAENAFVMAMTVFGLCAGSECIIDDAQAITKSYPTFFEDIQSLGGKVEIL